MFSNLWINYYLSLINDLSDKEDIPVNYTQVYTELYDTIRKCEISRENYDTFVSAIKLDIQEEGCCIGPNFLIEVALYFDLKETNIPNDWIYEAALRDRICDMGFPHSVECMNTVNEKAS